MNEGLTSVVALARLGLTTGFPALSSWCHENLTWSSPSGMDFLDRLCCFVLSVKWPKDFTGVHFDGHCNKVNMIPILEWTQVNVALGDFVALCLIWEWVSLIFLIWGFAGYGDQNGCDCKLMFSWRYWECMLVGRSKWVGPHLGGGWFQVLVWTQMTTALWDFVTLRLIWGCALGPLEASAWGSKTSSPCGNVNQGKIPKASAWEIYRTPGRICHGSGKTKSVRHSSGRIVMTSVG